GRPEGNVTGVVTIPAEAWGKHIELLKEAVPKITRLALITETSPRSPDLSARVSALGQSLQLTIHHFGTRTADDLHAALREALQRRGAPAARAALPLPS